MKFLGSVWWTLGLLALGSAAAFYYLSPDPNTIGNFTMQRYAPYAGWGVGAVAALVSLFGAGVLHGVRRLLRCPKTRFNSVLILLLVTVPWLVFSWQLLGEPSFTPIARAIIDFAARPLFWGSLLASTWTVLMLLLSLIPTKK